MTRCALVIGSGGREHALAARLAACPGVTRVVVCPGNAGTASGRIENVVGDPLAVARAVQPDLVVVGPEAPLAEGLVDALQLEHFTVFGPTQRAAQLESSKAFMKDFAVRHRIRTARHVTLAAGSDLMAALGSFDEPPVVKASGLCAGKGVVVSETFAEAEHAAREMLSGTAFGDAGRVLVLEERLLGEEVSIHAICDGRNSLVLPAIQDHKRIGVGDTGANTGGMGTYGPAPLVSRQLLERIRAEVVDPVMSGMAGDGIPFQGTLFAGLMVSPKGEPVLLEINTRFGDPETQVLMGLIEGDLFALLRSAAQGGLQSDAVSINALHGLCVVLAAPGYPGAPRVGAPIAGLERASRREGVQIYHAATRLSGEQVTTAGGRVLGVTAFGQDLRQARERAYAACGDIAFDGMQYRSDIGWRALREAPNA
jgi:phosphoribosylamine---glycine ligase